MGAKKGALICCNYRGPIIANYTVKNGATMSELLWYFTVNLAQSSYWCGYG